MSDKYSDRSRVVKTIFIVVGVLFVGRLAMLQLFDPEYREAGDRQALRDVTPSVGRARLFRIRDETYVPKLRRQDVGADIAFRVF